VMVADAITMAAGDDLPNWEETFPNCEGGIPVISGSKGGRSIVLCSGFAAQPFQFARLPLNLVIHWES